jgi:hypothetical protein
MYVKVYANKFLDAKQIPFLFNLREEGKSFFILFDFMRLEIFNAT